LHTLIGTALMAGGAAAFNMYRERDLDARMRRTAQRPLVTGTLSSPQALGFAVLISSCGFAYLFTAVNHRTGFLSAIVFICYLFLYTPLKTKTWLSTFIGAVPGALPVVMGWTAANDSLSPNAWILFAIVFLWQIPHFCAIGWLHRSDYVNARLSMISVLDEDGRKTGRLTLFFIAGLFVCTLVPVFSGFAGMIYLAGALGLGLLFSGFGINFARRRSQASARRLFIYSAVYLPFLLAFLMLDRHV
jgi:protoheme IX farnesyltransferase